MKNVAIHLMLILLVSACIRDNVREKMNEGMANALQMI